MAAVIEIKVRKIRGPWQDVVKQLVKKNYVMGIITAHPFPGLGITSHTAKPEVLPGVWKLTPYAKESAGGVKLVGIQAELFPQDFKRVNGSVRRWRLKLVINKTSVGFFEVEAVAIVRDGYVTRTEEIMEFLNELPIVLEVIPIPFEVREGSDCYFALSFPTIGEGEDVPVL